MFNTECDTVYPGTPCSAQQRGEHGAALDGDEVPHVFQHKPFRPVDPDGRHTRPEHGPARSSVLNSCPATENGWHGNPHTYRSHGGAVEWSRRVMVTVRWRTAECSVDDGQWIVCEDGPHAVRIHLRREHVLKEIPMDLSVKWGRPNHRSPSRLSTASHSVSHPLVCKSLTLLQRVIDKFVVLEVLHRRCHLQPGLMKTGVSQHSGPML